MLLLNPIIFDLCFDAFPFCCISIEAKSNSCNLFSSIGNFTHAGKYIIYTFCIIKLLPCQVEILCLNLNTAISLQLIHGFNIFVL